MEGYKLPEGKMLILRTCDRNLRSMGGFQWPESGHVESPDWIENDQCGNGLHGLLWGHGDGGLLSWESDAVWIVAEVDSVVSLGLKVKFRCANVIFSGDRHSATQLIFNNSPAGTSVVGLTATAGYRGTATAGYRGTATAGYGGTATAGDRGTATAGDRGTATAGYGGTATAGDRGILAVKWHDGTRYRVAIAYVGENGIKPNTAYGFNNVNFVEAGK